MSMTLKIDVFNHTGPTRPSSAGRRRCGLKFFGTDHVVFASDAPFDPEGGPVYIRETLKVIDSLDISEADRQKIYQDNAERLFNRGF
jgi:predicted TIM-barrel fold metal-dependent hydrolase